jgi:hypothetical protein
MTELRLNTAADRLKLVFHFKPTSCENAFSGSKLVSYRSWRFIIQIGKVGIL